jgi:phosphopantetheinyl transferase
VEKIIDHKAFTIFKCNLNNINILLLKFKFSNEITVDLLENGFEDSKIQTYKTKKRQAEFIGKQLLIKSFLGSYKEISYTEYGQPYLKDLSHQIGFTHSGPYVGLVYSVKSVGIDIEQISDKLERTKHKFCSQAELESINHQQHLYHLTLYWSAKETVYKAIGDWPFIFDTELIIKPFKPQKQGEIEFVVNSKKYNFSTQVYYRKMDNYVLSVCNI